MAIASALMTTAADYVQAQRVRRAAVRAVADLFSTVDVVLTPSCATPAPLLDKLDFNELVTGIYTPYWNGTGNPAISVPMGLAAEGLPVGLQIAGRPFEETTVLRVADAYQSVTDHHLAVPPMALKEYVA
jgi:aspartyl-tRNA(Asn)/glutamyl-tRNA(Gln) amidotransferase subunit A